MIINQKIKEELQQVIQNRTEDSFEVTVTNLRHFISCEGKQQGNYISTIECDGKDFEVYMI